MDVTENLHLLVVDIVCANYFLFFSFLLGLLYERKKIDYLLSVGCFIDYATFIPVYYSMATYLLNINSVSNVVQIVRLLRVGKIVRFMRVTRSVTILSIPIENAIYVQLIHLIITLVSILFVTAGIVLFLSENDTVSWKALSDGKLEFHDAIYFAVATFGTVGRIQINVTCLIIVVM